MEYIRRRGSYFMTETGQSFTPIGYNESFTWDCLKQDPKSHLTKLSMQGINCIRLMFEYAESSDGMLETSMGVFNEVIVNKIKEIFKAGKEVGIRFLVSPYDTYWQWKKWSDHPYAKENGGYLEHPKDMISHPNTLDVHKQRFRFLIENFSEDGSIFAWDLWNEIHPAYANESDVGIHDYVTEISRFVRETEQSLFGKSHLQTVSIYGPAFREYKHLNLRDIIFKHPSLDFCSVHLYDDDTINDPKDTVSPAVTVGRYVKDIIALMPDGRPFIDTESGPIGSFINRQETLTESFDDEYFSNMSWAHLLSGGAGPGMRWPYRHPHQLTDGMLSTLNSISKFSSMINWGKFNRDNVTALIQNSAPKQCHIMGCGSSSKYLLYALRTNALTKEGTYKEDKRGFAVNVKVTIPNVQRGTYRLISWKEKTNEVSMMMQDTDISRDAVNLTFLLGLRRNIILYIEKIQ